MDAKTKKRLRFVILETLYKNHERQNHRFSEVTLTGYLRRLLHDVYVDLVRSLLQDLRERGLISYGEFRNDQTGSRSIQDIQILPPGRDLVEANEDDPLAEV